MEISWQLRSWRNLETLNSKQLVAYAGLDPGVFSSRRFTASSNRITKRGTNRL